MNTEIIGKFLLNNMLINIVLLSLSSVMMMFMKNFVVKQHSKLFGLKEEVIMPIIYSYLGMYKLLTIVFAIVPYIAFSMAVN
ncbi:MAG: hypothetical protein PF692_15445 [Kiritimatiellae bacterium]|nr:hypothetical protein [Kiritimatiellia bacterium]